MTGEDSFDEILSRIGLTNYEIKVLNYLYTHDSSSADKIKSESGIPLARAYDALMSLEKMKFIERIEGSRPRIYTVSDPQEAISSIVQQEEQSLQERIAQLRNASSAAMDVLQPIYLEKHASIASDILLSPLSGLDDATSFTIEEISQAKDSIDIFSHIFNWFGDVRESLVSAIDRGCQVRLLLQKSSDEPVINISPFVSIGLQVKVITTERLMTRGTIIDGEKVIFIIWADPFPSKANERRVYKPQYSTNQGIVDVFRSYYDYLWSLQAT